VTEIHKLGIDAAVVGKVIAGRGRSKAISDGKTTPLSFSERDEILKVFSP
jgi:hypothetical protein